MQLNTKNFGFIDYEQDAIITFEEGLPGFPDTQFILLADDPKDLFCWLQSVEDGDLAFVLMDVKQIIPDYDPQIDPGMLESLYNTASRSYVNGTATHKIYNIAVVPDDLQKMRVNLKAPIVINTIARKGKQVVASNEDYTVRHYIFDEVETHHKQVMGC